LECQVRLIDLQIPSGCFQNIAMFGSTRARARAHTHSHTYTQVCVYELFSPMKRNRNSCS